MFNVATEVNNIPGGKMYAGLSKHKRDGDAEGGWGSSSTTQLLCYFEAEHSIKLCFLSCNDFNCGVLQHISDFVKSMEKLLFG